MFVDATTDTKPFQPDLGISYEKINSLGQTWDLVIEGDLYASLFSAAAEQGVGASFILLSVFQELLRRYTGQPVVTVRFTRGVEANDLVLQNHPSILDYFRESNQAAVGTQEMVLDGQLSFLEDQQEQGMPSLLPGVPLHCAFLCTGTDLRGVFQYDPKIWQPSLIAPLAEAYRTLLTSALSNLDAPLDELVVLSNSDVRTFDAWNDTEDDYPALTVIQMFEQRAAEAPDNPAVTFDVKTMTYAQLDRATDRVAGYLRSFGVAPGSLVGICMDRCNEMVVALLAVFKAGAAYIPLDPAFPPDRLAFMQSDAKPVVIVTQSRLREKLIQDDPSDSQLLVLDDLDLVDQFSTLPSTTNMAAASLDDLAYVLYTSGSTGKPKGVKITNRALTNLLTSVASELPLEPSDVFLATSSISFDISVFEIFAPLISAAHLKIAPRSVTVSGELLSDAIRTSQATVLQSTPSGWRILLEAGWQGRPGLKMLTAGEPLDRTLAHKLLDRGAALWNLYGPTEATIYATGSRITKEDLKITVGTPLPNYTTYVLDARGNRVPVGAIGELHIGGIGLADGYLNRPELTAEKFISNPVSLDLDSRLYRTGDLARFLPDGEIELLGRADNQIKLRGYRIELDEIEAILDSHPSIRKSVVKVATIGEGDQRLVAYFVPREEGTVPEAEIQAFAMQSLPSYMVPTLFAPVESFALTPTGKVDRKALPAILLSAVNKADSDIGSPEDSLEAAVLSCWRDVLKIPDLGLDQSFFQVGGHSLLAARMFAQMDAMLGCKLPVSLLVEAPTARSFARLIQSTSSSEVKCLVSMQPQGNLPPLYLVHHLLGDILIYRTVANCFSPDRQVFGIQPPVDLVKRPRPYGLEALAAEYVAEVLKQQSEGPFHLAGFSSGSVVAYEMARQLSEMGHSVGLLALIDGDAPNQSTSLPTVVKWSKIVLRKFAKIVFKMRDEVSEGPSTFVKKRLSYLQLLWRIRNLERSAQDENVELTVVHALMLAERAYRPKPYSGSALLVRFHDEAWNYGPDPMMGWQDLITGGIEVADFPGGHITGMSPAKAPRLAEKFRSHIEINEEAGKRRLRSDNAHAASRAAS